MRPRPLCFGFGVAMSLGAALSPLDGRFSTHMLQHLLLGDLGPLFVVIGLTAPLRRPRRALHIPTHPFVALPVWAAALVCWHLTPLYDAALRHEALHALQHLTFFLAATLLWAAIVEPLTGPSWFTTTWKLPYV